MMIVCLSTACTSVVKNTSLDYPLLLSNGTYAYTANNCVKCQCYSANNWTWVYHLMVCNIGFLPFPLLASRRLILSEIFFFASFLDWWVRLQCEQSGLNITNGTCPSMECGSSGLSIGNSTSTTCNRTTCAYAGYTNQTIFTSLVESTCSCKFTLRVLMHYFEFVCSVNRMSGGIYKPEYSLSAMWVS